MKRIAIIGAGIGGLTVGNLLIDKGHKVTLFEKQSTPGGYTAGFWRKGFYFESGTLSFESGEQIFEMMRQLGVLEQIPFIEQKSRFLSSDFDAIPENFAAFKDMLYAAYPSDRDRLAKYFSEADRLLDAMLGIGKPESAIHAMGYPWRFLKFMNMYRKYQKMTISEFTAQYFEPNSKLYLLLKGLGYPDMAAWILGGAIYTIFNDYYTVRTGMQGWADVLADHFRKFGGELLLNSPVDRILTQDGVAVGVSCKGVDHHADAVISAMDYKKTFLQLLDHPELIPQVEREKIAGTAVSEGIFVVYLGLNMAHQAMKDLLQIPHVLYYDEKPGADVHDPDNPDYFTNVSLSYYSPSLMNPKLAPEGKSTLMIQAVAPHRWMNNWGGGDKTAYKELKERVKETLIARTCALFPQIADAIEFEDAATPLTFERYTGNTDGATSAFSWNPNNRFYKNLISSHVTTAVKNLFIGSCWSTQIGGVPSAIGAAKKCAKLITS